MKNLTLKIFISSFLILSYMPLVNHIGFNKRIAIDLITNKKTTIEIIPNSNLFDLFKANKNKSGYLIAHAGGGINENIYTNSLEAVNNSIKNKFKFIELDLQETIDGKIVAVHNWAEYKSFINHISNDNSALSYDETINNKILNEYTPLSIDQINLIFKNNPSIILVTDKITNLKLLVSSFNFPERMIVEVFSIEKYNEAIELGINNIALNININSLWVNSWLKLNKIKAVTFRGDDLYRRGKALDNAVVLSHSGIVSLIYSRYDINPTFLEEDLKVKMFGVYTNFITPLNKDKLIFDPVTKSVTGSNLEYNH